MSGMYAVTAFELEAERRRETVAADMRSARGLAALLRSLRHEGSLVGTAGSQAVRRRAHRLASRDAARLSLSRS